MDGHAGRLRCRGMETEAGNVIEDGRENQSVFTQGRFAKMLLRSKPPACVRSRQTSGYRPCPPRVEDCIEPVNWTEIARLD